MKLILLILLLIFAGPLLRFALALLMRAGLTRLLAPWVGRLALSGQPDEITLAPVAGAPWREEPESAALFAPLLARGFAPAGSFTIVEFGGMPVHFLVHEEQGFVAALYAHPAAGLTLDIATKFVDGESYTVSNATRGGELDPRPGHPVIRMPKASAFALLTRALRERPDKARVSVPPAGAAELFADAYADGIAWRKRRGVNAREVAAVARAGGAS